MWRHLFLLYLQGKQEDFIDPRNFIFTSEKLLPSCLNASVDALITCFKGLRENVLPKEAVMCGHHRERTFLERNAET